MLVNQRIPGRLFFWTCSLIAVISFFLGEYIFDIDPLFAYYMLPTRAGELLVGALIAHMLLNSNSRPIPVRVVTVIAVLGLILTGFSLILLSEELVFPGFQAIPPTIGAAMLIWAGHYGRSWPIRLLMLRPMVWVGLISYSAYLWHWPLLAYFRYGQSQIGLVSGTVLFIITIVLAWLTYRYIETPARQSNLSAIKIFIRQYIVPAGAISILALFCMKIDGYGFRSVSDDYKSNLATLRDETRPAYQYKYVCQRQVIKPEDIENEHCILGDKSLDQPKAFLWGDSNAAHYVGMLGIFAEKGGFKFRNLEVGSCPPLDTNPGTFVPAKRYSDCNSSREIILKAVDQFDVLIISANWPAYQTRSNDFFKTFFAMTETMANKGKLVILLGKVPVVPEYDRLCREKALSFPFMKCDIKNSALTHEISETNTKLKAFASNVQNIEYYDIVEEVCPDGSCSAFDPLGKPIFYDSSHLTLSASRVFGESILQNNGVPYPFTLLPSWPHTALTTD